MREPCGAVERRRIPNGPAPIDVILAIDQGTTGTRCLVIDGELGVLGQGYREIRQYFPEPGWVEHDPEEIWESVLVTAEEALARARVVPAALKAIGISNQRETTIVWERRTGRPLQRAIVWQDRRTADRCRSLPAELIRERTGLVPDPYFSATKLEWILARADARPEELAFGTVDTWLVWKLTGGRIHVTEPTNAARTMLFDLRIGEWDDELLELFGVDRAILPRVGRSSEVLGEAELLGVTVPIAGVAGDQQAALFGQACFAPGQAKATYGTGSFVLVNVGDATDPAPNGLLKTAAAVAPGHPAQFAVEGAVLTSGAAIQWLRDGIGIVADAEETEALARSVDSSEGVVFVPALTGLGSPWWDAEARGLISGITRGTTRAHLARATLEGIACQVADVLEVLDQPVRVLHADGGASRNAFLMQLQADLLGCAVEVAAQLETTALGAAALAGLATGAWSGLDELDARILRGASYEPRRTLAELDPLRTQWRDALRRARLHD